MEIVNCGKDSIAATRELLRICCSHVKRIIPNSSPWSLSRRGANLKALEMQLELQRDTAFGKIEKSVPDIDNWKKEQFTSWHHPVNLVPLLSMIETGEIRLNHTLIENALRCEIGHMLHDHFVF